MSAVLRFPARSTQIYLWRSEVSLSRVWAAALVISTSRATDGLVAIWTDLTGYLVQDHGKQEWVSMVEDRVMVAFNE